ncbi:MAG: hypothetical protein RSB52_05930 [Acidaminococcaceae bacterium]
MTTTTTNQANLREQLAALIFELDQTIFHDSQNLEAEYMVTLGQLEFQSYVSQCDILRIRRKLEIVKDLVEQKRVVDLALVEKILDIDFADYLTNLQEQANLMKLALAHGQLPPLSANQQEQLSKLYHDLLWSLHPALTSKAYPEGAPYLRQAVAAYSKKDLVALSELTQTVKEAKVPELDATALAAQAETWPTAITAVSEQLTLLKKGFPFNKLTLLRNASELLAKQTEINEHIAYYQAHYHRYEEQLAELVATELN